MHHLTCTTITSVDLAHYGVSRAKDWVSVDCGISTHEQYVLETIKQSKPRISRRMHKEKGFDQNPDCLLVICPKTTSLWHVNKGANP